MSYFKFQSELEPRRCVSLLTAAALSVAGLTSCAQSSSNGAASNAASPEASSAAPELQSELQIVTSTLPTTDFTKAVAGDRAEVTYLLPTTVGPHDYQAKPEDVRTIAEADVLVRNGLGIDAYLDSLIENANNSELQVIDASAEIQPIANQELEGHDPAEAEAHDHAEGEAHEGEAAEAGHQHEGEFNPHVWLDPTRAIQQVETIRDGLIKADPEGRSIYSANAAAYIDQLNALDQEIASRLKPYAGKEFVTYHDFAPYFAERYGLKAEYLVGVPEENPSPADVERVLKSAEASDLKTLLTEPQAAGNPFDALAKDLNVKVSSFDPLETSGPEGVEPQYYLTVMRQNLKNLEAAFSGTGLQSHGPVWWPGLALAFTPSQPRLIAAAGALN